MKRPEIRIENHKAVYEFYQNHKPNPITHRLGILAFALAFRPEVHFADNAREAITDLKQRDTRFLIAPNHVGDYEQYVVAATIQRNKIMHFMRDNIFIHGKESLFKNGVLRRGIDTMGGVPTFRKKDLRDASGNIPPEKVMVYEGSRDGLIDTSTYRVNRGDHMMSFTEGERNLDDPLRVAPLKTGIGRIACAVDDGVNVAALPIGIFYGTGKNKRNFRPTVYIGQPLEGPFDSIEGVIVPLHDGMQQSVDAAIDLHPAA